MASLIIDPGVLLSSEVSENFTSAKAKYFHIKLLVMNSEWEFTSATEIAWRKAFGFRESRRIFDSLNNKLTATFTTWIQTVLSTEENAQKH